MKKVPTLFNIALVAIVVLSALTFFATASGLFNKDDTLTGRFSQNNEEGGLEGQGAYAIPHGKNYTPVISGGLRTSVDGKTYYYPFGTAGISVRPEGNSGFVASFPDAGESNKGLMYCVAWADDTNVYIKVMSPRSPQTYEYSINLSTF